MNAAHTSSVFGDMYRSSLNADGDKILIGMGSRKKGGQELEADHIGNSFEKFCYKRVKRNSIVPHRKSGNKKNFCWLGKKKPKNIFV